VRPLVVVGGPVSKRAWILDHWFNFVEQAAEQANVDLHYLFVADPKTDPETFEVIANRRGPESTVVAVDDAPNAGTRTWADQERKDWMVTLRNRALGHVRDVRPEYYLSLDSDILLHPKALESMIVMQIRGGWGAVGGKCYMTPIAEGPAVDNPRVGTAAPSYLLMGRAGNFRRTDPEGPSQFKVDIIMGIKLMSPSAYAVDYRPHQWGEDVGWAYACREAGVTFGWDGSVASKHVMRPQDLHVLDARCGY
jgi:hypothetical protein